MYLRQMAAYAALLGFLPLFAYSAIPASSPTTWSECPKVITQETSMLKCTNISVPLDYSNVDGEHIPLLLVKLPANDTDTHRGSLVWQLGGPGVITLNALINAVTGGLDSFGELRNFFDIVVAEPRGIGLNHPVKCDPQYSQQKMKSYPRTEQEFLESLSFYEAMGEDCLARTGDVMHHMDTLTQARDLEATRTALGDEKLNYYGLSWGTLRGSIYAHLFPNNIRSMILDGVVDHSLSTAMFSASEAHSYSITQNRMFEWMSTKSSSSLHGRDVASDFRDLVERADEIPFQLEGCIQSGACFPNVSGNDIRVAAFDPANNPTLWPTFAETLKQVLDDGNASAMEFPISTLETSITGSMLGIACQDWKWPDSWAEHLKLEFMHGAFSTGPQGPLGARLWSIGCPKWPTSVANPPASLRTENISAPIMIVNSLWDPATGYDQALNLHHQLEGSLLLTQYGEGHGSLEWPETRRAMEKYLIDLEQPDSETSLLDRPMSGQETDFELMGWDHGDL